MTVDGTLSFKAYVIDVKVVVVMMMINFVTDNIVQH